MLYRVGQVIVYGTPRHARLSGRVFRVSDTVQIGRLEEWSDQVPLETPTVLSPREWLLEALAQWPTQE